MFDRRYANENIVAFRSTARLIGPSSADETLANAMYSRDRRLVSLEIGSFTEARRKIDRHMHIHRGKERERERYAKY